MDRVGPGPSKAGWKMHSLDRLGQRRCGQKARWRPVQRSKPSTRALRSTVGCATSHSRKMPNAPQDPSCVVAKLCFCNLSACLAASRTNRPWSLAVIECSCGRVCSESQVSARNVPGLKDPSIWGVPLGREEPHSAVQDVVVNLIIGEDEALPNYPVWGQLDDCGLEIRGSDCDKIFRGHVDVLFRSSRTTSTPGTTIIRSPGEASVP